jgi:hypothetical protein
VHLILHNAQTGGDVTLCVSKWSSDAPIARGQQHQNSI